jgi:hypothetical protein
MMLPRICLRTFQVIGQPAQRFFQRAARFTRAHQADVELGKHAVLFVQRRRQACCRRAHDRARVRPAFFACSPSGRSSRMLSARSSGWPRTKQGRQLMRELRQLIAIERTALEQRRPTTALRHAIGRLALQRRMTLILQATDDFFDAGRLHLALQHFAGIADHILVTELGHVSRPA